MDSSRRGVLAAAAGLLGVAGYSGGVSGRGRNETAERRSVDAEAQSHGRTVAVTSEEELRAAFADLRAGDRVHLYRSETPYRIDEWLDVDESDVTVAAETATAENGAPIVAAADGAGVGGLRIGTNDAVERVRVEGFGFHGNTDAQDEGATRLHGIVVGAGAHDVTVRGGYITRTHPYERHNDGGSGISIRPGADAVTVANARLTDVGDRAIQVGGNRVTVAGNAVDDTYDRAVSLDVQPPDGNWYYATNARIVDNDLSGASNGSLVGAMGRHTRSSSHVPDDEGLQNVVVAGNRVADGLRNGIKFAGVDPATDRRIVVADNVVEGTDNNGVRFTAGGRGEPVGAVVAGNAIRSSEENGVRVGVPGTVVADNSIVDVGAAGIECSNEEDADDGAHGVTVTGNDVRGAGGAGIAARFAGVSVGDNRVAGAGGDGIRIEGAASAAVGNAVRQCGAAGVVAAGDGALVAGNRLSGNGRADGEAAELRVAGADALVGTNALRGDESDAGVRETDDAADAHYVGNRVEHDAPWALSEAGATAAANRPNPPGVGYPVAGPDGTPYAIGVDADGNVVAEQR